ncbi:hypothetical protein [Nonomuraea jiangxiensis]|uniref:Uncharacterized protein n=1 Tax=Nonomuraea jiangxiensis TaxID=633440 RepID=A0A1G8F958_9ACTN|nr:hypothetical protein [Nonomuraea jiangxiensis]SDH78625.1 hypothetical protein SAMN05421869_103246 [Nonomuraea jiangxiensis]
MRTTRKVAVVASLLAGVAAPAVATVPTASAQAAPAWYAYHNVSPAQSEAQVKRLKAQGYRPITVNVSDGERYAAVWLKDGSSTEWGIWQGMSPGGFQKRFDAGLKDGAQPVSVSATGSGDSAVFTAIWEKKGGSFLTKSNLTPERFGAVNKQAVAQGLALTSVDAYGTPGDVRYVGVWTANTGGAWYYTYGYSRQKYEAEFRARKAKGFRPVKVAVAPDGTYTAVWRKDGRRYANYIDMSSSGYQVRFNQLKDQGLHPVQVNAEGGKYAAIWE